MAHYGTYLASFVSFLLNIASMQRQRHHQNCGPDLELPSSSFKPTTTTIILDSMDEEQNDFWEKVGDKIEEYEEEDLDEEDLDEEDLEEENEENENQKAYRRELFVESNDDEEEIQKSSLLLNVVLTKEQMDAAQNLENAFKHHDLEASISAFHTAVLALATTQHANAETGRFTNITDAFLIAKNVNTDGSVRPTVGLTPGFSIIQYCQLFAILKQALQGVHVLQ